ncbi:MAG: restriction endonuclease [Ekhidna sp.]|nr:restriction endonuclease [Ekhidna sp.]
MEQKKIIEVPNMVWAFNETDVDTKPLLIKSLKNGKSRFGWSSKNEHNLLREEWSENHSKQFFLRQIKPGDWIVHINTPSSGECMTAKVISEYQYDKGLDCGNGRVDFRHCFEIDKESLVKFNRKDPNVKPNVNLFPRRRCQRVYKTREFAESIENILNNEVTLKNRQRREDYHLKSETDKFLKEITRKIHEMNRSKEFEKFLYEVFQSIPNVYPNRNGFGFRSDNGADLFVTIDNSLDFEQRIIIQAKSYEGNHSSTVVVNDIKRAFETYEECEKAIIITTGERTEELEDAISDYSDECGKEIELIAGKEVAQFAIKHAPEKVFNL